MSLQFEYYKNAILPRRRCCGPEYNDNEYYLKSARAEADRLVSIGLTADTAVLDIGCGQGRLAIGLLVSGREIRYYRGLDVQMHSIEWCQKFIANSHPEFQFIHIDVMNARYNRKGQPIDKNFRFPFDSEEFDIVYLFSVFTHMIKEDVKIYLREIKRLLSPSGKVFLSAFIKSNAPNMTINPEGYQKKLGLKRWSGKLQCVLYDRGFFESMLTEYGFKIDRTEKINEWGQEGIYVSGRPA